MRALLLGLVLAVGLASGFAPPAHAVDVSNLSDFESDPCVLALGERNTAQHADAPDSELSDACERAHGNVEVAWDFLTRTWRPRVVPVGPLMAGPLGAGLATRALLQILLGYVVLGGPLPGVTALLQPREASRNAPRRLAALAVLALLLRLAVATLLAALLAAVPGGFAIGGVAVLVAVIAALRWAARPVVVAVLPDPPQASAAAVLIAALASDLAARAPGLLALALLARENFWLLTVGVCLSAPLAVPALLAALRRLRRVGGVVAGCGVVFAGAVGQLVAADPVLVRLFGQNATLLSYAVPAVFALLAGLLGSALIAGRLPPGVRRLSGG